VAYLRVGNVTKSGKAFHLLQDDDRCRFSKRTHQMMGRLGKATAEVGSLNVSGHMSCVGRRTHPTGEIRRELISGLIAACFGFGKTKLKARWGELNFKPGGRSHTRLESGIRRGMLVAALGSQGTRSS